MTLRLASVTNSSDAPKGLSYPPPSIEGGSASTSKAVDPPRRLSRNTLDNIKAVVTGQVEENSGSPATGAHK